MNYLAYLPEEILSYTRDFLDAPSNWSFTRTCTMYRKKIVFEPMPLEITGQKVLGIFNPSFGKLKNLSVHHKLFRIAAKLGYLTILKEIHAAHPIHIKLGPLMHEAAASGGQLGVIRWLRTRNPILDWDSSTRSTAALLGHFDILKYTYKKKMPYTNYAKICDMAAFGGHIGILKWMWKNHREDCEHHAFKHAGGGGHINILKWMLKVGYPFHPGRSADLAASHGQLSVMKWLRSRDIQFSIENAFKHAVYNGQLEIVKWLLGIGEDSNSVRATIDEEHIKIAAEFGYTALLDLFVPFDMALLTTIPLSTATLEWCYLHHYPMELFFRFDLKTLKWFHEKGLPVSIKSGLVHDFYGLEEIKWFHSIGHKWTANDIYACRYNNLVVMYMLDNGCDCDIRLFDFALINAYITPIAKRLLKRLVEGGYPVRNDKDVRSEMKCLKLTKWFDAEMEKRR